MSISANSPLAPNSRKRRAVFDLADELSHFDGNWRLNDEFSLDMQGLSQLITSDTLQSHSLLNDNYAPDSAYYCSDLEDFLNFLWMEDDSASTTESPASHHDASSDQISLISDLDLDYGSNESSSNQAELNYDDPSSDNNHSLEVKQAEQEGLRASWQNKEGGSEIRASWQKKEGSSEFRASWQEETTRDSWQGETRARWQGQTRAGWQQKQGEFIRASWWEVDTSVSWQNEARASWQGKQEEQDVIRASWQQKQEAGSWEVPAGSCKEESVTSGKQGALRSQIWAGPTLLEIESALAISGSQYTSPISTLFALASPSSSSNTKHGFFDVKKLLSNELPKSTGESPEQNNLSSSWRLKLQKRNNLEPKYTVKVEGEEKALGDGYKWRKYGQKSIKSSPFPRSYYRCSNGKCNAKKQVEKCHEDAGLFLVTYEGIHLHHRPNSFKKICMLGDLHEDEKANNPSCICSPSSSTSCS